MDIEILIKDTEIGGIVGDMACTTASNFCLERLYMERNACKRKL